jgi:aldehyde:ferredoxin oxidoreductase
MIIFKGIADKPVYLFVDNGKVEIRDAAYLWGKDTYDTDDILKKELGADTAIACIGPGGEKLSLLAGVVHNKGSVAARSGLGAVMGSKKIAVPLADEKKTRDLRNYYMPKLGGHINMAKKWGTTFTTVPSIEAGDSPIRNYGGIAIRDLPDAKPLGSEPLEERKLKNIGCYRCPVGCETTLKEGKGEYKYAAGSFRPEYETLAMLGSNCGTNNLEAVIMANDLCNRLGIDTISAGSVVAFAMECYENGILTKADTDGLELNWGNHRSLVALTEKIGRREGLGNILADGVKRAAEKIGKGSDKFAMHVAGQEVPGHNPAASNNVTVTYLTDATPARHTQGSEEHHCAGLIPDFNRNSYSGRGQAHQIGYNYQHSLMCTGVCLFVNMTYPHADVIAEFMAVVTGWDIDTPELVKTGERIANIRQAFNQREGVTLKDYKLPGRVYGNPPVKEGPLVGVTVDKDVMVKEFLQQMDWDPQTQP